MSATSCTHCGEEMGEAFSSPDNSLCGVRCVVDAGGFCDELSHYEVAEQYIGDVAAKAHLNDPFDPLPFAVGAARLAKWMARNTGAPGEAELVAAIDAFIALQDEQVTS